MVNDVTVYLICELLALPGSDTDTTELKSESDVELLLTFVINVCVVSPRRPRSFLRLPTNILLSQLLRSGRLANDPTQGANRKARRLMFKLISMTTNIPSFLFIANVTILEVIGGGGFGRVFKGLHGGKHVAVKELQNVCHQVREVPPSPSDTDSFGIFAKNTLLADLCREALVWRSLSHRFILPLLGIYAVKSEVYLVSEFMPNGTITEWRKGRTRLDVAEIHRLVGIQQLINHIFC